MYCKVLHVYDYHLPETMVWLKDSWDCTTDLVEHHLAPVFFAEEQSWTYPHVRQFGLESAYPPSVWTRLRARVMQSSMEKLLEDYVRKNDIKVIHFHFGHIAARFEKLMRKCAVRCLVSLYGFDYSHLPQRRPSILESYRRMAEAGALFISEGQYSKRLLSGYGIPGEKIHVVQMFFKRASAPSIIPWSMPLRLIQVATFTQKKGQLDFLEGLSSCGCAGSFEVRMFGEIVDAAYAKELRRIIKTNRLNMVRINGKLPFDDYISTLKRSHVAVNVSRHADNGDSEGGCPVFLKDAMSCGKPVLTSYHCDIPELAVENHNAWMCAESSPKDIARALREISVSGNRNYLRYCRNAYETAHEKIQSSWTRRGFLNLYLPGHEAGHI